MDINDFLSLETFPKCYEACFLENCAVKEDCLHHLFQVTTSFQYMGRCNLSLGTYARKPYQWSLQNVSCEETCHLLCRFHSFLWRGKTQGLTLSP